MVCWLYPLLTTQSVVATQYTIALEWISQSQLSSTKFIYHGAMQAKADAVTMVHKDQSLNYQTSQAINDEPFWAWDMKTPNSGLIEAASIQRNCHLDKTVSAHSHTEITNDRNKIVRFRVLGMIKLCKNHI